MSTDAKPLTTSELEGLVEIWGPDFWLDSIDPAQVVATTRALEAAEELLERLTDALDDVHSLNPDLFAAERQDGEYDLTELGSAWAAAVVHVHFGGRP